MSEQRPGMFAPALIGGAAAGVLSGIPLLNCLCCVWIIGGAMLAAFLLVKDSPVPLNAGDGAIVGVLAGIVAAFVSFLISLPLAGLSNKFAQDLLQRMSQYAEDMPEGWETWFEGGGSVGWSLLGLVVSAVIFSALGALGGILGVSLFKKKTTPGVIDVPQDSGHSQP